MYVYILYRKKSKKKNEVQIKQRKEKIVKKLGQPDFANKSEQFDVWYCIAFYFMGGWQILLWPLWLIPLEREGRNCGWVQFQVNCERCSVPRMYNCITG